MYSMMNPLTHFINLSFSTNPTIAVPNQGLGLAMGGMLTDNLYVQGGLSDANGQPTHAGWNTFLDDGEYFSYCEVGVTTSQDRIYLDNAHVTFWHVDPRQEAAVASGRGVALSAQRFICDKWLPFVRAGLADGDASLLQATVSAGIGRFNSVNHDLFGVGFNWGKPAAAGLRDQFTSEIFHRFQLTESLAVTPDVQLIVNPALNPDEDVIGFFGIRLRAAF